MDLQKDIQKILISEEELAAIVKRLAEEIDRDYAGKKLLLVGILKGSVVFMGDLMKHLKTPLQIDFMKVSSYGSRHPLIGIRKNHTRSSAR